MSFFQAPHSYRTYLDDGNGRQLLSAHERYQLRMKTIREAAAKAGPLPASGQIFQASRHQSEISQITGIHFSVVEKVQEERGKIDGEQFVAELEWLYQQCVDRCMLDAEMWVGEILAYLPSQWASQASNDSMMDSDAPSSSASTEPSEAPQPLSYSSRFARTLIKNKDFRRAAHFLEKTMATNKSDHFLYYRSMYLAHFQEHLENDSEGIERKTSFMEHRNPFSVLFEKMTEEGLRAQEDPWYEYLMGLIEVQLGQKSEAEKSFRSAACREPRMWPAWEGLSLLIHDIEDAHSFSNSFGANSLWMSDWFMVIVFQRFHQHTMAIQKAETLVTRGLSGLPMIITKIAACSNARHDHDQAIENFQDVRAMDPYRLTDLQLFSDSLYIRNDNKKLSELALEVFKTHKFRWETCCIVANYHAMRRDSEHAIKFFQRALRLNPGFAALWVLIGHEFMEMKNNAAACVSYRRAIEIDPADHRGWYGLGQMYDIMKMPAYSLYYYQEAQKCKPHDSRLLVALGEVYGKLNKIEDAEKCFTGAYLFGDVEGNALWNLAKLHEQYNDNQKAAQVFEVFLVIYELVTSAEEKVMYAVAFLANHYFKNDDFEKSHDYATKCLAYESLCQEGNRLFRAIAQIHEHEAQVRAQADVASTAPPAEEGRVVDMDEEVIEEGGEEEMSEGEDELTF